MLELREYQKVIVDYLVAKKRCNLFVPMGLGKTVATLTAIDALAKSGSQVFPVLVIAPRRVAESTWPTEVEKFPHIRHLRVSVVIGTLSDRKDALAKRADIYCINYENLQWLNDALMDAWPFKMIVADECTKLKGFRLRQGSVRARAIAKWMHTRVDRYVGLTGTPASNGVKDLWAIMWMVDRGVRLGRSFTAFKDKWFKEVKVGADEFAVRLDPLPGAQDDIENRIKDVCLSLKVSDYFDLSEAIVNTIRVTIPPKAMKTYREMERKMFIEFDDGISVEAMNAASKTMKCLQIANGAIYTDETCDTFESIHDAKIDALDDIIEEASGMPVLVAYHFKSDLVRLQKAFPKGRHLDKNPRTIIDWNAGKIPVLFAHPASAGHGLNLQDGSNIIAFFSLNWNLEERLQIIERIGPVRQAQSGHKRSVFIHNIVAANTIDEVVLERVNTKRDVLELLMEHLRMRKNG